ncbi:MAG TPA: AraC family transcriptional regulator [Ruminiclostridium sp.]|nr:AraC family transcriptional regulator [Ruminiclostridium sp.]
MHAWESIQKTLNWIEENLSDPIEMEKLAEIAHLSSFYYQRLFGRLVGKPVMEYVKLRRLANAAGHLAKNQGLIVDAAFRFGFESHESFTRAFKDAYGITPEEYRAAPRPLSHFLLPDLSLKYYLADENVPLLADGIILEVHRYELPVPKFFAGLTIQNSISDTPGVDYLSELWTRFHHKKPEIQNQVKGGNELGASFQGEKEGFFSYFVGTEVTEVKELTGFSNWTLPSGEYAVCSFQSEDFYLLTTDALNKARDYMLGVWLPSHKLSCEPFIAEVYFDTSPLGNEMEIWLKIKSSRA